MLITLRVLILFCILPFMLHAQDRIDRIAFGSCSFQFGKQKIWKSVVEKDPQLWVWLGDIIYADTKNMDRMRQKYEKLHANRNYGLLREQCPIIATWDDHDFGGNNVGGEYLMKEESERIFLDFFGDGKDDPRTARPGIYHSYSYGSGDEKLNIIMLDTRYFREEPGPEADMLGEAQWKWLEAELRDSDAALTIIGSSIQFVAEFRDYEHWGNFSASRKKLLELIADTEPGAVVFISGDVHFGEVSKRSFPELDHPIYDLTSSGLTHGNQMTGFKNPYRVGDSRFGYRNFGFISIDWEKRELLYTISDRRGNERFKYAIPFSEVGGQ